MSQYEHRLRDLDPAAPVVVLGEGGIASYTAWRCEVSVGGDHKLTELPSRRMVPNPLGLARSGRPAAAPASSSGPPRACTPSAPAAGTKTAHGQATTLVISLARTPFSSVPQLFIALHGTDCAPQPFPCSSGPPGVELATASSKRRSSPELVDAVALPAVHMPQCALAGRGARQQRRGRAARKVTWFSRGTLARGGRRRPGAAEEAGGTEGRQGGGAAFGRRRVELERFESSGIGDL